MKNRIARPRKHARAAKSGTASIASRLRSTRELRGWSREALAFHSGVSWAAITQIESGRRTDVRVSTLEALAAALGVTIDHLSGRDAVAAKPALEHSAVIYETPDEFLEATVPFLEGGMAAGHAGLAVTTRSNIKRLQRGLKGAGEKIEYVPSDTWYRDPFGTVEKYRTYLDDEIAKGYARVRIVGEPVWPKRSADAVRRWIRYEAIINLALAQSPSSILCPYDGNALADAVVSSSRRTHPEMHGDSHPNPAYEQPEKILLSGNET